MNMYISIIYISYISVTVPLWYDVEYLQCPVITRVYPCMVLNRLPTPSPLLSELAANHFFRRIFNPFFIRQNGAQRLPKPPKGVFEGAGGNGKTIAASTRNHYLQGRRGSQETSSAALCER